MIEYPWYAIADSKDGIEQGDIIRQCPYVIPLSDPTETPDQDFETDIVTYDIVIMSQSCDIENQKIGLVLVCPIWPLEKMIEASPTIESQKKQIMAGNIVGYHLLDKCLIKKKVGLSEDGQVENKDVVMDYELPLDPQEYDEPILGYGYTTNNVNNHYGYEEDILYYHDYLLVDFRHAFSIPLEFLLELAEKRGKRLRLLTPFREHLSQTFARFIMRVGLPDRVTPFD